MDPVEEGWHELEEVVAAEEYDLRLPLQQLLRQLKKFAFRLIVNFRVEFKLSDTYPARRPRPFEDISAALVSREEVALRGNVVSDQPLID